HVPGPAAGEGAQRAARRAGPPDAYSAQTSRMIENVTLLAAFGAGLLSFISGLSLDEMRGTGAVAVAPPAVRNRVLLSSLAFNIGFSLVFVALGASAGGIRQ